MAATFATFTPARAAAEDTRAISTSARRSAPAPADIQPIYMDSFSIRLGKQGIAQHTAEGSARATTRAAQQSAAAAAKLSRQLADPADVTAKLWRSNWDLVTEAPVAAPVPAPEAKAVVSPRPASTSYRPRRSSSLAASLAHTAPPADVPAPATEPDEPVTPPARQSSTKPESQPLFVSPDIAAFADFEPGSQRGTHRDRVRQASPALEASMKSTSQSYFITGGAGSAWHIPEVGLTSSSTSSHTAAAGVVPGAMLSERLDDATSFSRSSSLYRATGVVQVHVDGESAKPTPPQLPEAADEVPARPRLQSLWASRPALAASISEDQDQRAALARKPATAAPGMSGGEPGTSADTAAQATTGHSDPATHTPRISNPGATLAEYGRSRLQSLPDISEHDVSDSEQSSSAGSSAPSPASSPAGTAPTPSPAPAMPSRGPALLVRTGAASSLASAESQAESDVPARHGRANSVPRDVEQHQRTAPASQPPPHVSAATQRDQADERGSARRRGSSASGSAFEPGDSAASPMRVPSQAPAVPSTSSSAVQLQADAAAQPQATPQESGDTSSARPPDRPPTPPKPRPSLALPIPSTSSTADDSHFPPADPHGHSPEWKHVRLRHIGRPLTPQACPTPLQSRGSVATRMFPPEANLPPPAA